MTPEDRVIDLLERANQVPDPDFPGSLGAEQFMPAVYKPRS